MLIQTTDISARDHRAVLISVQEAISHVNMIDKLALVGSLLQHDENRFRHLQLLPIVMSTLDGRSLVSKLVKSCLTTLDKCPEHMEQKHQALSIIPKLSKLIRTNTDTAILNHLLDSINIVIQDKVNTA
jgi:hypothetical protein